MLILACESAKIYESPKNNLLNCDCMRRVFLAINLPPSIKGILEREVQDLKPRMPSGVRFLKPENWHITLSFLGYQGDDDISKAVQATSSVVRDFAAPEGALEKIIYGPKGRAPRMIWITTDETTSSRLTAIKQMIENKLEKEGVRFRQEGRKFNGHVTLARFDKGVGMSELPPLNRKLGLNFIATSLELMESELKRGGAEYTALGRFRFGA